MRGIMSARTKPLEVIEPTGDASATKMGDFELPEGRSSCKMVQAGEEDELVRLLKEEAKAL